LGSVGSASARKPVTWGDANDHELAAVSKKLGAQLNKRVFQLQKIHTKCGTDTTKFIAKTGVKPNYLSFEFLTVDSKGNIEKHKKEQWWTFITQRRCCRRHGSWGPISCVPLRGCGSGGNARGRTQWERRRATVSRWSPSMASRRAVDPVWF